MYLENDAFRVEYQSSRVSLDDIMARIRGLGYRPKLTEDDKPPKDVQRRRHPVLPEPIARAAEAARENSELVFVDFYASWCAPCNVLEREVLSTPAVAEALEGFRFVRVDTDRFPKAAERFGVVGLPTLVVVDLEGEELFRHLGPIEVGPLTAALRRCKGDGGSRPERD